MKIEITKPEQPAFKPVSFTVTCESQDELDAWGALFNHSRTTQFLGCDDCYYEKLEQIGADVQRKWDEYAKMFK